MPKKFPAEFKRDVVAVARRGQLTQAEIASDFGISETTLRRWLRQADIDDGKSDGVTSAEQDELVQLRRRARILEAGERDPAAGRGLLRQGLAPKMTYPLVRDLAADGVPVQLSCQVLGFSRQAFYAWCRQPGSQREWDDAHLVNAIIDIHADDPEFGYRFITDGLHLAGWRVGENRVQRLCAEHGVFSTTTRKGRKTSGKQPGPAVHDDHVQRDFTADRPDQLWLTD